jgi:hypothetical protein
MTPEELDRFGKNVKEFYRRNGLPMGEPAATGPRPQFDSWQDALAGKRK